MDQGKREELLRSLNVTERDCELLRGLGPVFERHVPSVIDQFCEHMLQFEHARHLLADRTTIERLKHVLRDYLLRITSGKFDEAYFEDRRRIGQTHERVGLAPHWYLVGHPFYYSLLSPLIGEHYGNEPERARDSLTALMKIFTLDASLALEAYSSSRDISERKRAESALRESEERFRAFMDHSPAVAWIKDDQFRYVYFNRTYERVFQINRTDWLGKEDFALWPTEVARQLREHDLQVLATRQALETEEKVPTPGGLRNWLVLKFPLTDSQGRTYVAGKALDITEMKRLETALGAAAEQERGRIARDLHDGLGQQLGGALFLSELLCRDLQERGAIESARAVEIHELIVKSLAQVREVSRGLYPVPPEPDGLRTALINLAERVRRDRQIDCVFDADSAMLLPDGALATHLYRIAQEAVNNALKHSSARRIEIKLGRTPKALELSVRDYGTGLPQDARTRGLGLQTMNDRARLIGAELVVQNAETGGVRVVCALDKHRITA